MDVAARVQLPAVEQRVCELASKLLCIPRQEVLPSSRLIEDLHCDSLDLIELIMSLEEAFSVTIPHEPPNPVYKAVFTRRPFRLRDLAEAVYLQQGTGAPQRRGWLSQIVGKPAAPAIPFTQLNGRWEPPSVAQRESLFELIATSSGGGEYRRQTDGMRCLLLPSAEVEIGSLASGSMMDEQPLHRVGLDRFVIDAEPVSTTAYCRFLNSIDADEHALADWVLLDNKDDRQCHMLIEQVDSEWRPIAGVEHLPMILVSWYGANPYSLWANGKQWRDYQAEDGHLPSEAQWEYAARGPSSQSFPWGDSPIPGALKAAQHEPGATYTAESLPMAPVNECLGMSPFGLYHMAGNVWQWCLDWYEASFYRNPTSRSRNPVNRSKTGVRSERGGSWVGPADLCRSSYRRGRNPAARGRCLGFRCVSTPDSLPKSA